jgi:hypothetical protein
MGQCTDRSSPAGETVAAARTASRPTDRVGSRRIHIVAAVALGARFTLIGRAYLYGLMAGGEAGVPRAIDILAAEIARTMRLLGATCLEELKPSHVTQLQRLAPIPVIGNSCWCCACKDAPKPSHY